MADSGAELKGQLKAKNQRYTDDGELDLPIIDLNDICDDCACELHFVISAFCIDRTVKRITT